MVRKKLKQPDRIKNIFMEKPANPSSRKVLPNAALRSPAHKHAQHQKSKESGLMASEPAMHGLKKQAIEILQMDEGQIDQ